MPPKLALLFLWVQPMVDMCALELVEGHPTDDPSWEPVSWFVSLRAMATQHECF